MFACNGKEPLEGRQRVRQSRVVVAAERVRREEAGRPQTPDRDAPQLARMGRDAGAQHVLHRARVERQQRRPGADVLFDVAHQIDEFGQNRISTLQVRSSLGQRAFERIARGHVGIAFVHRLQSDLVFDVSVLVAALFIGPVRGDHL